MQKDDLFVMIIELGVIILINECYFGFFELNLSFRFMFEKWEI